MATSSAGSTIASLRRANDLLGQLRQSIRQVEVVPVVSKTTPGSGGGDADSAQRQKVDRSETVFWTASTIQAFNNSSIRTVAAIREALADARYEAEQRDGDGDGGTLLTKVAQAERDLEHLRSQLRRSVAARKRHEERRYNARGRAELLGTDGAGGSGGVIRRRGASDGRGAGDSVSSRGPAGEAREMKLSLQRTRKMMAEQLERVAQVSEVMGEQDALLRDTYEQHQARGIGGTVRRARTTLHRLKAADIMDTVFMVGSTFIFFATVCFVLYQRLPTLGLL
ncbi:unnamed protein product [Sphacelaria rigidula]